MDLLKLLGINHSDLAGNDEANYRKIKKTYYKVAAKHHPDKTQDLESHRFFNELSSAWTNSGIHDGASCAAYLRAQEPHSHIPHASRSKDASYKTTHLPEDGSGDSLRVKREGIFTIHIPVIIRKPEEMKEAYRFYTFGEGGPEINFTKLTTYINAMSSEGNFQVGVTRDEANEIINQHSHRSNFMIIAVEVDINRLSDTKLSERDVAPGMLNARDGDYFFLLKGTTIGLEDIHSIDTSVNYWKSMKPGYSEELSQQLGSRRIGNSVNASALRDAQSARQRSLALPEQSEQLAIEAAQASSASGHHLARRSSGAHKEPTLKIQESLAPKVNLAISIVRSEILRIGLKQTGSSTHQAKRQSRKAALEYIANELQALKTEPPTTITSGIKALSSHLKENAYGSRSLPFIANVLIHLSNSDYTINPEHDSNQRLVALISDKLLSQQAPSSGPSFGLSRFFSSARTLSSHEMTALTEFRGEDCDIQQAIKTFQSLKPPSPSKFPSEIDVLSTLAVDLLSTESPSHGLN